MANIITATVTVRGKRPILWHHFGPDAIPLVKGEKTGVAGHDPEEWRKTVTVTRDGQLYIEPTYAFGCIVNGAKYTKKGRAGSIQSSVAATLQVTDDRILIDRWLPGYPNGSKCDVAKLPAPDADPEAPVYMDIRSVVNPSTKGRNVRYRIGACSGWTATFHLQWDKTIVSRSEMESALKDAGNLFGLGSGRKIGMGRFDVQSFEVEDA